MIICYKPEKRQKREIPQPMFNLLSSRPLVFLSSCLLVLSSPCLLVLLSSCHLVLLSSRPLVFLSSCLLVLLSSCPLVFLSSCLLVLLSSCPLVLSCHALEDVIAGEYSELASLAEIGNSFFFIAELQINKSSVKIGLAQVGL